MTKQITTTFLRSVKPGTKPFHVGGVPGLMFIAKSQVGSGRWMLRYYALLEDKTKKRCKKALGSFPEIGLKEARELAANFINEIASHPDKNKDEVTILNQGITFREAAIAAHNRLRPKWKSQKHANQWINTLEQYAYPLIGDRFLFQITPQMIENILKPIWLESRNSYSS